MGVTREPSTETNIHQPSSRPSLMDQDPSSITPTRRPTVPFSLLCSSSSLTGIPTSTKYTFMSPLLEMTLFGLNTTLESTIAQIIGEM